MKNKNDLVIDHQALELCHFLPDDPLSIHMGENTMLVIPERMTAMEAVNTIGMLSSINTALLDSIRDVCGSCGEQVKEDLCPVGCQVPSKCPFKNIHGPRVTLSDDIRREMGVSPDTKLHCFVDEGEAVVTAADYEYDITDVPESVRALLSFAGVCPGRLDQALKDGAEVWHG